MIIEGDNSTISPSFLSKINKQLEYYGSTPGKVISAQTARSPSRQTCQQTHINKQDFLQVFQGSGRRRII